MPTEEAVPVPMQQFIGTKMILGKPMTLGDYNLYRGWDIPADEDPHDIGWLVEYPDKDNTNHPNHDGYISWSPAEAFKAYRPTDGMTFGLAIEAMKIGLSVRLPHWAPDVFISLQLPDELSKMTAPYMYVTSNFGRVPWIANMIEQLAENWMIIE